jgi:Fic family protein
MISAEGRYTKWFDEIARLAGASRSTARNSVKEAVHYGILERLNVGSLPP